MREQVAEMALVHLVEDHVCWKILNESKAMSDVFWFLVFFFCREDAREGRPV